jgi:hypothetical protein
MKKRPTILYGGFSDDKLDWNEVDDGFGGHNWRKTPALFKKREEARVQYEDVRRVELREQPRKTRR